MSLLKKMGLALVVVLVVLQAFKPEKNVSDDHSKILQPFTQCQKKWMLF
jgi:hypothetical protein